METEFEKLGAFYLGRKYDLASKKPLPELVLYDSKDLTTHAVCIGMTGSGKTGLCLGLVEEAAIDAIPVIAIDVKGDISNLLLNFPTMSGKDLEPWLDERQAQQAGMSQAEFADKKAADFRSGIEATGQSLDRIRRLRESADFALYTPGSSAGTPISVLKHFEAPPPEVLEDGDQLRDRISASVTSLLVLLGIDADPLQSREHILLANILRHVWSEGISVDVSELIQLIQKPPITRIGAIELDSIFPSKDRFQFAMQLNNLLASPGFEVWTQGPALEIDKILYSDSGKPKTSIFYIAHLNDTERMFFVSLLLNRVVGWMRAQSGTSSLRAIVYMDEIFGFFPPVSNPPSKQPLLTLLKQARAFGLGVMLATQNPVDIDYKGLSNAGTWFIGRLQTERDKARLLDGLEGASGATGGQFDRQQMDNMLSALGNRVFLMNNVHDEAPQLFQTRSTLSFLAGPLTLEQIKKLKKAGTAGGAIADAPAQAKTPSGVKSAAVNAQRPLLPPEIKTCFLPIRSSKPAEAQLIYAPRVFAVGNVRFVEPKASVDTTLQYCVLGTVGGGVGGLDWQSAQPAKVWMEDVLDKQPADGQFESIPPEMSNPKSYAAWNKEFASWLYAAKSIKVFKSEFSTEYSKPRESERDFRIRIAQSLREKRDAAVEALKAKWAPKLNTLEDRLHRAQQTLDRERAQATEHQLNSAVSIGATVLGAMLGNRRSYSGTVGRASTAARSMGRAAKEQQDVHQAQESVERLQQQMRDLDADFAAEMSELEGKFDAGNAKLSELTISPKKANITVPLLAFAWAPYWKLANGTIAPAWIKDS